MACPPDWLTEFANDVAQQIRGLDVLAPIGCHYHRLGDEWEVSIFVAATEVVGGCHDGRHSASRFAVDLNAVRALFATVNRCEWQALEFGPEDDLGPHISLEGTYRGHSVWLRILAEAPSRFGPGRLADVNQNTVEETW